MQTLTYKCPSCASPLVYDGISREMTCGSCGNTFDLDTIQQFNAIEKQVESNAAEAVWNTSSGEYTKEDAARLKTFSCSSCGAQLMTDATTVATNCAFCGSPSILPTQFSPGTRPSRMIPFTVTKEQATAAFHNYFKGKKLIPNIFKTNNTISEIRQLYVPYWLFTCTADADISYRATSSSSYRQGEYRVTKTRHFLVRRAGTLDFKDLPVDASTIMPDPITESIEPYSMSDAIDFVPAALSGAQADRADVSPAESKRRADERIRRSTEDKFRSTVMGYDTVTPLSTGIRIPDGKCEPVLFPVWQITTTKNGQSYTFAINGQTGELTCNLPYSKSKYFLWLFGLTAGISAAGLLLFHLLRGTGVF